MKRLKSIIRPVCHANRIAYRVLLALVVVTVLINIGFRLGQNRLGGASLLTPTAGNSERLILAEPVDDQDILIATRDNALILLHDGAPTQQINLDTPIVAIAVSSDGQLFLVGDASGKIQIFNHSLAVEGEREITGRVLGLAMTPDGTIAVGHGFGAVGTDFFVSAFAPGETTPKFQTKVGFLINEMRLFDDHTVLFGTNNSQVGTVDLTNGEIGWNVTLQAPVTSMLTLPDNEGVVVGSKNGTLSRLDANGKIIWAVSASQYTLRGIGYDAETGTSFVGDANGALISVNAEGRIILSTTAGSSTTQTLAPAADNTFVVIPRDGPWKTLDPSALGSTQQLAGLRLVQIITNIVLLLGFIASAIVAIEPARLATRRQLRLAWRGRLGYLLILPAIILILFFSYYAGGLAFYYSLTNFSLRSVTKFIGLDNYRTVLLDDRYFRVGLVNMIILTVTGVIKTLTVPLLAAELVFWLRRSSLQYLFRTLFILPAVVPGLVFTLMWRQVYDPNTGLLNELLKVVGLGSLQRAWLGDSSTALWSIVGVGFPYIDAFGFLIFLGGLLNINPEYFDAAKVDGASMWSRFFHIDIRLLVPQFRIMLFFALLGSIQGFASILILTRGGPGFSTYVPALQMYLQIAQGEFGYASAIGVILFVLIFSLTIFSMRFHRNEAIEGG